ncbi:MAG: hypothetical protein N0E48_26290 [Candidatus Thiodiazotropha endolucinida]|nr:hypothetical protein [Candidatus Thiodiazotropha endolucinida]
MYRFLIFALLLLCYFDIALRIMFKTTKVADIIEANLHLNTFKIRPAPQSGLEEIDLCCKMLPLRAEINRTGVGK